MRSFMTKLKTLFLYLLDLPKAIFLFAKYYIKSNVKNHGKCDVFIDTFGLDNGRRMAQLVLQLKTAGFKVGMKVTFYDFLRYRMWIGEYTYIPFLEAKMTLRVCSDCLFVICSRKNNINRKKIIIDDDIFNFKNNLNKIFFFPILFHPLLMQKELQCGNKLKSFAVKKHIGVLFVGNASKLYSSHADSLHYSYFQYTRSEVLEHIKEQFPESIICPTSIEEYNQIMHSDISLVDKIVILDKIRVEGESYWELLKSSIFHLWTVGVMQPYCHNQVESMSCGCIPIFQSFPFYPGLINDVNCYIWKDFSQLDAILENIIAGRVDYQSIEKMHNLILENYEHHFSKNAFRSAFCSFVDDDAKTSETYYICPKIVRD